MNIALAAYDTKKLLMQSFCIAYKGILARHDLYATGTTGRLIEEATNLSVHKYLAGSLGGEKQMEIQLEANEIDMVIYLRDAQSVSQRSTEVDSLFNLCDIHNIPFASNLATAELLIKALDRGDLDWRELYKN